MGLELTGMVGPQAYVNEKVAPDILEYDEELVERLQQRLKQQVCHHLAARLG